MRSTASVLLIVGCSALFAWVLTVDRVPTRAAEFLLGISREPWVLLLIVNLLLLGGHIGREGCGAVPVRGHSNVQGDRTVGIDEKPVEQDPRVASAPTQPYPRGDALRGVRQVRAQREEILLQPGQHGREGSAGNCVGARGCWDYRGTRY